MTEPPSEQQQPKVDEQPKAPENAAGEQPAAEGEKEQQTATAEQPAAGAEEEQQPATAEQPSEEVKEQPAEKKRKRDEPAHLGYIKFTHVDDLVNYFKHLLHVVPKNLDMNEYEHMVLLDLLKQHPEWDRKVGPGIKSFQVREIDVPEGKARAFFAMRKDGSMEDFSYIKCAGELYPGEVQGKAIGNFSRGPGTGEGGRGGRGGSKGNRGGKGGRGGGGRRGGRR